MNWRDSHGLREGRHRRPSRYKVAAASVAAAAIAGGVWSTLSMLDGAATHMAAARTASDLQAGLVRLASATGKLNAGPTYSPEIASQVSQAEGSVIVQLSRLERTAGSAMRASFASNDVNAFLDMVDVERSLARHGLVYQLPSVAERTGATAGTAVLSVSSVVDSEKSTARDEGRTVDAWGMGIGSLILLGVCSRAVIARNSSGRVRHDRGVGRFRRAVAGDPPAEDSPDRNRGVVRASP